MDAAIESLQTACRLKPDHVDGMDNPEALAAAKSHFNACAFRDTTKAVDLVAQCLAKSRATDTEIGRKFRSECVEPAAR
jgi:hypothetical protein